MCPMEGNFLQFCIYPATHVFTFTQKKKINKKYFYVFAEIVRAMTYVISQGWAMYWGTARWSPTEIMEAYTNCRQFNCITPIVEQAEYHMFYREKAELYLPELYNKIGVGLMAWGPLAMALGETQNGERLLFPKGSFKAKSHSYSWTEDELNKEERLEEGRRHCDKVRDLANLAEKLGCSAIQLSIAWSLKHEPVQCLLLGATSPEQLHQSLQALQVRKMRKIYTTIYFTRFAACVCV